MTEKIINHNSKPISFWAENRDAILFFFAFFIFAAGISLACYNLLSGKKQTGYNIIDHAAPVLPQQGRTLVILVDSIPKDFMFSDCMPFISGCRDRGAWGVSEVVSVPLTIAGQSAIFSGTVSNPLAFFEDYQPSNSDNENLFKRVAQQGRRSAIFGKVLRDAYGKYTDLTAFNPEYFSFGEYREEASYIFKEAYRFLKDEKWDVAAVTFDATDHVGHLETPGSENYLLTAQLVDKYVQQLVGLTTKNDTVLITSEHGMDDRGFHTDRTHTVIETGFILLGPMVKRCGYEKIWQIDLAPTLSVLSGVSPFYNPQALPAINLLKLPDEEKSILVREFSRFITGASNPLELSGLYKERESYMAMEGSVFIGMFAVLTTFLSLSMLSYMAVFHRDHKKGFRLIATQICTSIFVVYLTAGAAHYFKFFDIVSNNLPFSANFIISHHIGVIACFAFVAVIARICRPPFEKMTPKKKESLLLFLFVFIFSGILISDNPYHPLNWMILAIPLIAWGILRHPAWLVVFGGVLGGVAIRRLTFYNANLQVNLPDRWFFAAAILIAGLICLLWLLRNNNRRFKVIRLSVLCFAPGIAVIAYPFNVEIRAVLLLISLIPIIFINRNEINRNEPEVKNVLLAVWVVFFYLGTSGSINHISHIASFPILLAVWAATRGTSAIMKGVMVSVVVWAFYFIPGNSFDLNLLEIKDRFILDSASNVNIEKTVLVIAGRYILPAAILIWMLKEGITQDDVVWPIAAAAFMPVAFGIGTRLAIMVSTSFTYFPWEEYIRVIVLLGHLFLLICAFFIVAGILRISKLFPYRMNNEE